MQLDSQNLELPTAAFPNMLVDDAGNALCQAGFESIYATRRYCNAHVSQQAREKP